eukprot:gene16863-19219_t
MATKPTAEAAPKKEVAFQKSTEEKKESQDKDAAGRASINRQSSQPVSREALKALTGGIGDAIVDIRLSSSEQQEADLSRNGYVQLLQEKSVIATTRRSSTPVAASTFGNHSSLWTWSRSQGTCSGRLKPIIDVQLHNSSTSSDFVLAGYTCDTVQVSGQWLWIKRATTDDEEKDAIVDLYISTGKMKDSSDPIWTSPGVGWVRVDGNFTKSFFGGTDTILWLRPARTRSVDSIMASPIRGSVALTEEVRYAKLMSACRLTLRHYVSVENVKRLATLVMETAAVSISAGINSNVIRSERMVDYTALYHQAVGKSKGQMTSAKLTKLLYQVGLRLDPKDLVTAFSMFDRKQNGLVSLEEFGEILSLTDYELDLAVEKIRVNLLKGCSAPTDASANTVPQGSTRQSGMMSQMARAASGVLGSGIVTGKPQVGKNIIRENFTLVQVFQMVNTKNDGIFGLDEMMDLSTKVEVFVTEEEARKCLKRMDLDGDDRVEEADFIGFMRQDSRALVNKAFRVREASCILRRWLVRGTTELNATTTASASKAQWKAFKHLYQQLTKHKFPGYLDAQVLLITMSKLGMLLSALETRELTLLVAPEKSGRVHQADLHTFMGRENRTFGELIALIERDLLRDFIDIYRAHHAAQMVTGQEDLDLAEHFKRKVMEIKKAVEKVYQQPPPGSEADPNRDTRENKEDNEEEYYSARNQPMQVETHHARMKRANMEVISIQQLKDGLEFYFKEQADVSIVEPQMPNLEEWAALAVLVNADVCEGDIYGVRLKEFLEGLCQYSVAAALDTKLRAGERNPLEQVARDLQRQIYVEALNCGKGKKPDFRAVFDIFDDNKNGEIAMAEFKEMLKRLQLVTKLADHQIPNLLALFSPSKNVVRYEDFVAFAMKGQAGGKGSGHGANGESEDADLKDTDNWEDDEEDEEDIEDMTSNVPPVTITRNGDCDWLLWFLYRESRKVDPMDPESVITELQIRCNETEMTQKDPAISVKEMWNHLFELGLQGGMNHVQFVKGVQLVCQHANGKDDDRVDYEALCRYVVRMGRAYNALVQQRAKEDEGKFAPLLAELKKYFQSITDEKVTGTETKVGVARYEKIFRRIDTDGDGMLTPKEFKTALKRLQYKSVKAWNIRMVRRLFDECDKNRDGLLSIKEFTAYVHGVETSEAQARAESAMKAARPNSLRGAGDETGGKGKGNSDNKLNLSDDEDDEVFRKNKVLTDHQLLRKVNDTLMDIVPVDPHGPGKHTDVVRASVRRFFQRADPDHRGYVSEERFRAFLRRSGLQDNLTASELRRLTDKLKKKSTHKDHLGEVVIDYEKLLQQMNYSTETIPKSKAEIVMTRFQDAVNASATAGRSFVSLCSLVDLHLTGRISKDELLHTAKMMDCPLTPYDLEAMLELLPNHAVSADEKIDYRLLQTFVQNFTARQSKAYDIDPHFPAPSPSLGASGALPSYATPRGGTTHLSNQYPYGLVSNGYADISTPMGNKIQSPYARYDDPLSTTLRPGQGIGMSMDMGNPRGQLGASSGAYERILRLIVERVKAAVEERTKVWGPTYALRDHLEYFDTN